MGQLPLFAVWSGLGIVGVRNQDHAGVWQLLLQQCKHFLLGFFIQCIATFVQKHPIGLVKNHPRNHQALLLTA